MEFLQLSFMKFIEKSQCLHNLTNAAYKNFTIWAGLKNHVTDRHVLG